MKDKTKVWIVLVLAVSLLVGACAPATKAPQPTATALPATAKPAEATAAQPTATPPPATAKPAAATPAAISPTSKPAPVNLKMSSLTGGVLADAGVYIAKDKGYFVDQGLNIEFVPFQSFSDATAPLSTGQLDGGGGGWNLGLANALVRGAGLKMVADKVSKQPGFIGYGFAVRKDLYDSGQVKTAADLKGRKVAVSSVAAMGVLLVPFLKAGGLTLKDVDLVALAVPDYLPALANKSVDAAVLSEPNLTKAIDMGLLVRTTDLFDSDPAPSCGVIVFSSNLAANTDAATRFMIAYIKGVRDYNDAFAKNRGRKEIVDILAKNTGVADTALYEKMGMPGLNPDGYVDRATLAWTVQYWASTGELTGPLDIDKVVDNSFVENALKVLGKYAR